MLKIREKPQLGLIMGSRLYFNFHPAAVETDEMFKHAVDLVQRELGDRGRRVSEGVPPPPARVAHAWEPEPEPEPEPAPKAAPAVSRALAPATPASASSSFTPSMQQSSSPALHNRQSWSLDDTSLVEVLLIRKDKIRQEAQAERAEMEASMEAKLQQLREEMEPRAAVSAEQIAALQVRMEALHDAELLIEDTIADFVKLTSLMGAVTLETVHSNAGVGKLIKLVALSSNIAADGAFARQLRRKHAA